MDQTELQEVVDVVGKLAFNPPPMKHCDTRDSITSVDSDMSMSYDRRGSAESATSHLAEDEGAHMADMSDSASDGGSVNGTGTNNGGGKDSGCEVTTDSKEIPFVAPSEELTERIVAQVEFYFSDANITKDAFLLKHVKRNKEGYVSLKLISSFKRVKHLTKDWRVAAHALARSSRLEINELGTKIRRLDPLPQYDETTPSRTIVAVEMVIEKPTIENVAEVFSACGEIALIRVLRPGNPIPADVRTFLNKNPSLNGVICALVEFVESESARNAMKLSSEEGMKVYELNCIQNEKKKRSPVKKTSVGRFLMESEYSSSDAETDPRRRLSRDSSGYFPNKLESNNWLQRRMSSCSFSSDSSGYYQPRRLSSSSRDSGSESFLNRKYSNCSTSGSEGSRKTSNCSMGSDYLGVRSRSNSNCQKPEIVVRTPIGPDGSKGFIQRRVSGTLLPTIQQSGHQIFPF